MSVRRRIEADTVLRTAERRAGSSSRSRTPVAHGFELRAPVFELHDDLIFRGRTPVRRDVVAFNSGSRDIGPRSAKDKNSASNSSQVAILLLRPTSPRPLSPSNEVGGGDSPARSETVSSRDTTDPALCSQDMGKRNYRDSEYDLWRPRRRAWQIFRASASGRPRRGGGATRAASGMARPPILRVVTRAVAGLPGPMIQGATCHIVRQDIRLERVGGGTT